MSTVDQTGAKWEFDSAVTDAFDDMLARSIPDYDQMRHLCFQLGDKFCRPGAEILDLGCSRGEALAPFIDKHGATMRYLGTDVSEPMLIAARKRYEGYISCNVADVKYHDLRYGYPACRPCVTLMILTLQFTPIEHRQRILRDAFKATLPGGCLVLVEKVLGATADIDHMLVDLYYDTKRQNGYSQEQIDRKRLSLEGVLVPVTAAWNVELLRQAGFSQVDCFWRRLNFAGWLAIKE